MLTLQNIKDTYYHELSVYNTERRGFEEYLRAEYLRVYDIEGNLLGYERN